MKFVTSCAAALLLLAVAGCGNQEDPTSSGQQPDDPQEKADKPHEPPKLPDEDLEEAAAMEILVTDTAAANLHRSPAYTMDEKAPSGTLRGMVLVSLPRGTRVRFPQAKAVAIKIADKHEAEYYQNINLQERLGWWFHKNRANNRGSLGVAGAVLMLRGIKSGRRAPLQRASYLVREARIVPAGRGHNFSYGRFNFGPPGERVQFGTYDSYACHLEMAPWGARKPIFDGEVRAFDRKTIKPIGGGGVHYRSRPKLLQSPPIHETGIYRVTCGRHAWQVAYYLVVDNPYVVVTTAHYDRNRIGRFEIKQIPVGRHTVEVWHPEYEPVKKTVEVEIRENDATEIVIEFKVPRILKKAIER